MPFYILREDVTCLEVDGVVNPANRELRPGEGVCGQIFRRAASADLVEDCARLGPIETSQAVMTSGYGLPASRIIHAVGPVYAAYDEKIAEELLRNTYRHALEVAQENHLESVAFPLISAGIYGYPKEEAFRVATAAIRDFLKDHELTVFLCLREFPWENRERFIEGVFARHREELVLIANPLLLEGPLAPGPWTFGRNQNCRETFSELLFRLIDERGLDDVEVYKGANLDRKLFSKIRRRDYTPGKRTVLALAISLELSLSETNELLKKAGYALSDALLSDTILAWCIEENLYDVHAVNEILFAHELPLLGASMSL